MKRVRKNKKIALIFGTRPEIIKLSPIIRHLEAKKMDYVMIHSNQHYSYRMDRLFFKELNLPKPHYRLSLTKEAKRNPARQIAEMITQIDRILKKIKPRFVLVQGDTNTVLAGAIATNRLGVVQGKDKFLIELGHVEAGLRSYDRRMPEEFNRRLADECSDYLFAPTALSKKNLIQGGLESKRILVTGNTVVDAVKQHIALAKRRSRLLKRHELKQGEYGVLTLHRPENVDHPEQLEKIVRGLKLAQKTLKIKILFPIHPRTYARVKKHGIHCGNLIQTMDPIGYLDFLYLLSHARVAITDSGGIQEEACILKVPCVTVRKSTERPETVYCGANRIAGTEPQSIAKAIFSMLRVKRNWNQVFGKGDSGKRIVQHLIRQ